MQNSIDLEVSDQLLRKRTTISFLLFLLFAQVVLAQEKGGQIQGHIKSDTGQLLHHTQVTVVGSEGFELSVTSNGEGYYQILRLKDGVYQLELTAESHLTQRKEGVEIQGGETITLNFRLLQEHTTLRDLTDRGVERRNPNNFIKQIDNNALHQPLAELGIEPILLQFTSSENQFALDMGAPVRQILFPRPEPSREVFHGSLHVGHQNSSLNARPFFNVGHLRSSKRNQFGLSANGPLIEDRIFFTSSLNFVGESGYVNGNIRVPKPNERTPTSSDSSTANIVTELLKGYPTEGPNLSSVSARQLNTNSVRRINSIDWDFKADYPLTVRDHLAFRYTFFNYAEQPFELVVGQNPNTDLRSQTFGITHVYTWSPSTLFQSSFQFDRMSALLSPTEKFLSLLKPLGMKQVPDISFGGDLGDISAIGPGNEYPRKRNQNRFSGNFDFSHQNGKHQLRFGGRTTRIQINDLQSDNTRGSFSFSDNFGRTTVENFLKGTPTTFNITSGNLYRGFRNWEHALYGQDSYQIRSNFTLSLGLRYEAITAPKEVNNRMQFNYKTDANNFAPHLALAWAPGGGKTVVRAGYGIAFSHVFVGSYQTARFNPPDVASVSIQNPSLFNPLQGISLDALKSERAELNLLSPDLVSPYSHQYNLVVQRRLSRNFFLELGYIGHRTHKPFFQFLTNRAKPVSGIAATTATIDSRRPDSTSLRVQTIGNSGIFYYDGGKASLRGVLQRGLTFNVDYVFSKAMEGNTSDFMSDLNSGGVISQDGKNSIADLRGRSTYDRTHILTFQYSYALPFQFSSNRLSRALFNDWEIIGTSVFRSGHMFGISSSSDAPGFGNVDGEGDDRVNIVNPKILGSIIDHPDISQSIFKPDFFNSNLPVGGRGNLGLSVFGTDAINNTNLAVSKSFRSGKDEMYVRVRMEFENLFNHAHFQRPGDVFPTDVFGKIVDTENKGRTIQARLQLDW